MDGISNPHAKKYFSQLPHILFDKDLTPMEFKLWCYYNRVGNCWQSAETTAKGAGMSIGSVSASRKGLADKGLITCKKNRYGGYNIVVADLWLENMQAYSSKSEPQREGATEFEPPLQDLVVAPTKSVAKNNPSTITHKEECKGQAPTHAPASIDDLLPQDDLYRDGMTKADYIAAEDAEIDQLAPYEKAIRAVIAQSRMSDALYRMLGETAKAYRDAGLTPDDIRTLWATNSGSFWKAHTVGGSKPNSGKPWLGNVSGELSRAVEFLANQAGATEATALYREWIQPLAGMNGTARDYFKQAPLLVKRALSANGMGNIDQIKRVSEADFAGWYAGVK